MAFSTCCTPCNSTTAPCDDGPGNDVDISWGTLVAILVPGILACCCCVGGVGACMWWLLKNQQRHGGRSAHATPSMTVMRPMNIQGSIVSEYEGVNQVEMSALPSYDEFAARPVVTGTIIQN